MLDTVEDAKKAADKAVKKAAKAEESGEKAKEKLPMTEFSGHPFFEWLHYEVNLPAAYNELVAEQTKASLD